MKTGMQDESKKIIKKLKKNADDKQKEEGNNSLNDRFSYEEKTQSIARKIIKRAERQKLLLRSKLVVAIKHIIWFQLVFFNIVVLLIVSSVTLKVSLFKNIDSELAIQLFRFLKYYIGATVVELLGMIGFILRYVFSPHKILEKDKKK